MSSAELPVRPPVPSWRLVTTLAGAGVAAGLLIVSVHLWTQPRILAHQAETLRLALQEVLGAPASTVTLYLIDGGLTERLPDGVDSLEVERVFVGFDEAGNRVGVALTGAEPGFQDVIRLIFGYDPREGRVLGMKVLENKETPGLGDKIVKDSAFVGEFRGALTPLAGVKPGTGTGKHDVDMITGATISSKAVIAIINHRLESVSPLLDAYFARRSAEQISTAGTAKSARTSGTRGGTR